MLFDPKNRKKMKVIWTTLSVLIILSMILLSIPALFL